VFFPLYSTMMLGFESNTVIGLRMLKLVCGGSDALQEMHLMIGEKVDAAIESVINRYRQHVAANTVRLSRSA